MSAEPTNTRAIRSRIIVKIGDDWHQLSRDPQLYKDDILLFHFVSDAQVADADGNPIQDEIETPHPDRSGSDYEDLFELGADDVLDYALAHGYLDSPSVSPERRRAFRSQVRIKGRQA